MPRSLVLAAALALSLTYSAWAQTSVPANPALFAPTAPEDRPINVGEKLPDATLADLDQRIAPAIRQARKTLPQAKRRFLAGLPAGQGFFVSMRLQDPDGVMEQVFVRIRE